MEVVCRLCANAMSLCRRDLSLVGPGLFGHPNLTATGVKSFTRNNIFAKWLSIQIWGPQASPRTRRCYLGHNEVGMRTGEMAQWLSVCSSITDPSSVPRTHIRVLTTACHPSSGGSDALSSGFQGHLYIYIHRHR